MSDRWRNECLHQMYFCRSLSWKKVFIMHSALLKHSCSMSLLLSLTSASPCRPFTPFHTLGAFLAWAFKSSKRIVDSLKSLVITHRRASLISDANSWYTAGEFEPCTSIKHRECSNNFNLKMHTLDPSGIYSSTQLASWGLTSLPTPTWANSAGSTPELKSFHPLYSSTVLQ